MQHAKQADFEPFDASDWQIAIVVAEFNHDITESLYQSAVARSLDYNLLPGNITTIRVAGSIEIPLALQHMAKSGKYAALLAIGCIIKGDTPHFDYVARYVSDGILRVQLDHDMPIGFGVLTCNSPDQAQVRCNLGGDHLDAVLQQTRVLNG